jgi:glycosyltransferase involved in cell wall biosynthesis
MKQGFYLRFNSKIKNEKISLLLSYVAYFFYCCLFWVKKVVRNKNSALPNFGEAKALVTQAHSDCYIEPIFINPKINEHIDLSIVIPVYNYVNLIEKNIISILNQKTKYSYEVILIDDGSTDGAKEILKKYENAEKVKVIFQSNMGIAGARNTGINNACGKYLMFIDCDDEVHNDLVEELLSKAYSENFDMVICGHNLVKEANGKVISSLPNIYPRYNLMGYKNNDEIMNYPGLPWCKVYRRELWDKVRFFPGYWYEDTIIHMLIFPQCKNYAYIQKSLYEYKWYENNFSHTQNKDTNPKSIDRYWMFLRILNQYDKLNLKHNNMFYTLLLRHLSVFYYSSIKGLDKEIVNSLFVLAKELYKKYKPSHKVKLSYMLKQVEKAFDNDDIELWKLASMYQ